MRRPAALPRRATLALALLLALGFAEVTAPAPFTAAELPTFDAGQVSADFPNPVSWRFVFESDVAPTRVELLRRLPGADATLVTTVGPDELVQRADGSWLVSGADEVAPTPNTPYRLRLRVTTIDGVFLGPEAELLVEDDRFDWQVRESERLRVHWYEGGAGFADRALRVGEAAVTRAEEFLGVRLPTRVDMFIYAEEAPFRDAIGPRTPENAAGVPFSSIATFFALIRPEQIDSSWVSDIVPHELTHLVFEAAIGPAVSVPLWLNEGFAVYLSIGYTRTQRQMVENAIANGTLVPLDGLVGNFPTNASGNRSLSAYAEAASAVDYMVRTYGEANVARLVGGLGSAGADDAFVSALGIDSAAFGAAWLDSLDAPQPTIYGPQPAPTGPLPSDWLGPAPSAGLIPASTSTPAITATPGSASPPGPPAGPLGNPLAVSILVAVLALAVLALALRARSGSAP